MGEGSVKYLSVCSGIEAATVAWHPLGWESEGAFRRDIAQAAWQASRQQTLKEATEMCREESIGDEVSTGSCKLP